MKIKKLTTLFVFAAILLTAVSLYWNSGAVAETKSVSAKITDTLSGIAKGLKAEGEEKRKHFREDKEKLPSAHQAKKVENTQLKPNSSTAH